MIDELAKAILQKVDEFQLCGLGEPSVRIYMGIHEYRDMLNEDMGTMHVTDYESGRKEFMGYPVFKASHEGVFISVERKYN